MAQREENGKDSTRPSNPGKEYEQRNERKQRVDSPSGPESARISNTDGKTGWESHPEARFSAGDRVQLASVVRCMPMDLVHHEDEEGTITGIHLEANEAMENSYHVVFDQEADAQGEGEYWIRADKLEVANE